MLLTPWLPLQRGPHDRAAAVEQRAACQVQLGVAGALCCDPLQGTVGLQTACTWLATYSCAFELMPGARLGHRSQADR